jgi:hypothetical protein
MVRLLAAVLLAIVGSTASVASAYDVPKRHDLAAGVEISYISVSGLPSWTEGSVGKLRYSSDGLVLNRAFLDYRGKLGDTLDGRVALEAYDDDIGDTVGVTQAYLEWRPVPRSANRYRLKVGAFYAPMSLENVDPGWSSRYTLNSSAINTWIAEELRTVGAELSISRRPTSLGGAHTFEMNAALFVANDPAGSLLAWKGWSVHDRQSRIGDELPLAPLPQIQPGGFFEAQDPYVAPFREIDDRIGYYLNGEWRFGKKFLVRAMHYDNRADPVAFDDGQYAWETKFEHIAVQATLPGDIGMIAQWITGSTVMGPVVDGAHMVDAEFESKFLLITKAIEKHRLSARYDNFDVTQNDRTAEDNNPESGHAWTLAYQYTMTEHLTAAVEWLSIKTHRCGWVYYGIAPTATEEQTQLTLKIHF